MAQKTPKSKPSDTKINSCSVCAHSNNGSWHWPSFIHRVVYKFHQVVVPHIENLHPQKVKGQGHEGIGSYN